MAAASAKAAPKKSAPTHTKDQLLAWYKEMVLIRRMQERAGQLYGMGKISGFCHLYIGQEAVVTGIQSALGPKDTVITAYRAHAHALTCGIETKHILAELTGRAGGCSKGKGGSMHMFDRSKNFYGGHGIVGAQVPIGTGLAFAHQYKKDGGVCVTYFGDGAANQGQVYEAMNMAALWKLPVLFVIENNQYAMGTSLARGCAGKLSQRGEGFDIPGREVDGMDLFAVRTAAQEALAHVRAGKGPLLLEIKTYRYRGHSMSDPGKYRSKDEVEQMKTGRDCIEHLRAFILDGKHAKEDDLKAIDQEVKTLVQEAVDFSLASPEPDASELWTDVLVH